MTERHRFYLVLASIFGVLVGAASGLVVAFIIGIALAGGGCTLMAALKRAYGEKWGDTVWAAVAVGAVAVGLMFLLGAAIFLTLHEAGTV